MTPINYYDDMVPIAPYLKAERLKRYVTRPRATYETVRIVPDWDYIKQYINEEVLPKFILNPTPVISDTADFRRYNSADSPYIIYNNPETNTMDVRHIGTIVPGE